MQYIRVIGSCDQQIGHQEITGVGSSVCTQNFFSLLLSQNQVIVGRGAYGAPQASESEKTYEHPYPTMCLPPPHPPFWGPIVQTEKLPATIVLVCSYFTGWMETTHVSRTVVLMPTPHISSHNIGDELIGGIVVVLAGGQYPLPVAVVFTQTATAKCYRQTAMTSTTLPPVTWSLNAVRRDLRRWHG